MALSKYQPIHTKLNEKERNRVEEAHYATQDFLYDLLTEKQKERYLDSEEQFSLDDWIHQENLRAKEQNVKNPFNLGIDLKCTEELKEKQDADIQFSKKFGYDYSFFEKKETKKPEKPQEEEKKYKAVREKIAKIDLESERPVKKQKLEVKTMTRNDFIMMRNVLTKKFFNKKRNYSWIHLKCSKCKEICSAIPFENIKGTKNCEWVVNATDSECINCRTGKNYDGKGLAWFEKMKTMSNPDFGTSVFKMVK